MYMMDFMRMILIASWSSRTCAEHVALLPQPLVMPVGKVV